jgi:murein DD-endopeptidase MepM/ murein hydrolase activator NlpD
MVLAVLAITALSSVTTGSLRFDPPSPRLGDLVLVYFENDSEQMSKAAVRVFNYEFPMFRISPQEMRAVVAVPIDAEVGEHDIVVAFGERLVIDELPVSDREFDTSELNVGKQFTAKKSKSLIARLKEEERQWQILFKPEPQAPRFSGALKKPVAGEVTGVFGTKRVFNGKVGSVHYGLDLDGRVGDPIRAVQAGKVVMSSLRWASGGTTIIDHGGGLFTAYFHMSKRNLASGDRVKAGELIGAVGKTGRVTGPHLHLAVMVRAKYIAGPRAGATRSLYVDPESFLGMIF